MLYVIKYDTDKGIIITDEANNVLYGAPEGNYQLVSSTHSEDSRIEPGERAILENLDLHAGDAGVHDFINIRTVEEIPKEKWDSILNSLEEQKKLYESHKDAITTKRYGNIKVVERQIRRLETEINNYRREAEQEIAALKKPSLEDLL